jgi:hypothetical protein
MAWLFHLVCIEKNTFNSACSSNQCAVISFQMEIQASNRSMICNFEYELLLVDQNCIFFFNHQFHFLALLLVGFEIFGSSVENP